jgi:hypothetical protein
MNFRLDEYEPVEARIKAFWEKYPEGRLHTDLIHFDSGNFIVKASAYTDRTDPIPAAIDYAHEVVGNSPVNKNFALENCTTSALGRCLATLGFAPKGKRPSREEMAKVIEMNAVKAANPLKWGEPEDIPLPPEPTDFDPFQQWPNPQPAKITEPNFAKMSEKQLSLLRLLFSQLSNAIPDNDYLSHAKQSEYCSKVINREISIVELSSKEASAVIKSLQKDLEAKK